MNWLLAVLLLAIAASPVFGDSVSYDLVFPNEASIPNQYRFPNVETIPEFDTNAGELTNVSYSGMFVISGGAYGHIDISLNGVLVQTSADRYFDSISHSEGTYGQEQWYVSGDIPNSVFSLDVFGSPVIATAYEINPYQPTSASLQFGALVDGGDLTVTYTYSAIPEPSSLIMAMAAILVLTPTCFARRRWRLARSECDLARSAF